MGFGSTKERDGQLQSQGQTQTQKQGQNQTQTQNQNQDGVSPQISDLHCVSCFAPRPPPMRRPGILF